MNNIINCIKNNRKLIMIIAAAAMVVLFAVCPVIDIMGKASVNGLGVLFKKTGIGFGRWFIVFLMLAVPLVVLANQFVNLKIKDSLKGVFELMCFGVSVLLFLILAICLPEGISVAVGAYLYLVLGIVGGVVCFLAKTESK